jgi:hypothetical protein
MSRVRVTIDQVALKGFEAGAGRSVVEALKAELSEMLADPEQQARWARSRHTPVLRVGRLPFQPGTSGSRRLGGAIARGIGKGLEP